MHIVRIYEKIKRNLPQTKILGMPLASSHHRHHHHRRCYTILSCYSKRLKHLARIAGTIARCALLLQTSHVARSSVSVCVYVLGTRMCCAKTAESIGIPFGGRLVWTQWAMSRWGSRLPSSREGALLRWDIYIDKWNELFYRLQYYA